ncbi:carbohydrate kinase family protein [Candidatus Cryosericum terrychapinii]|uniref:Carbohydrate kinase n=1 Tax=Candidatus Cryosericum terrychapinii TaxID=2290919 RepID=A0A398D0A2_9BACT|nr:carbohydrate kinase [Candidatus Cryosericum terrychapinii]RIE05547.1 carbohydrate kinase [Candidatus Cryosericum terrychapinii]
MLKPVLCGGEILLDFLSKDMGKGLADSIFFEKRPGGSIFNVAVGLRRLGVPASLLTKLGGDEFSQGLMSVITEEKINTECLMRDPDLKTTLAFVALNKEGKPEFRFYRENAADTRLTVSEVERIDPQDYSMYHFGSIALLEKPASDAYLELLNVFRAEKVLTSFDPNIRPSLINDRRSFLDMFYRISEMVDIMKLSDDDLEYITGLTDVREGLRMLPNRANALTLVTLGKNGAIASYKGQSRHVPTFNRVRVKDTTGCGDAFMAAIISGLLNSGSLTTLSMSKLTDIVTFANAAATIVGTRYGAANAMPRPREVGRFLSVHQNDNVQDGASERP